MYRYHLFTFPKKCKYLRQFLRNLSSYLWLLCEKFWKQIFIVTPAVSHQNGDSQSKDATAATRDNIYSSHACSLINNKQTSVLLECMFLFGRLVHWIVFVVVGGVVVLYWKGTIVTEMYFVKRETHHVRVSEKSCKSYLHTISLPYIYGIHIYDIQAYKNTSAMRQCRFHTCCHYVENFKI